MLISHTKQFIFIHNYKVAGTSIREALGKYRLSPMQRLQQRLGVRSKNHKKISDNHLTAVQVRDRMSSQKFDQYFKFGFVRNPWDWQASLYKYALKNKNHKQHHLFKSMKNFEEYLHWRITHDFRLQKDFFYDDKGECLMNYIGRYESLVSDFESICQQIGIQAPLAHRNKSQDHQAYLKYYQPQTVELVYEHYREDVETFDYPIPEIT